MTNPDPRRERAAICDNGEVDVVEMDGEPGISACIGCAGCEPHRYRAPAPCLGAAIAAQATTDRAWIASKARQIQATRTVAPMRFRAS